MTLAFSTDELAGMQAAQDAHMMDTCRLVIRVESDQVDDYGQPVVGVVETTLSCGLDLRASREYENAEARMYDARLRLPIDTEISHVDEVVITHRHGVAVDELRYDVIGDPRRGPSGLVLELRSRADD